MRLFALILAIAVVELHGFRRSFGPPIPRSASVFSVYRESDEGISSSKMQLTDFVQVFPACVNEFKSNSNSFTDLLSLQARIISVFLPKLLFTKECGHTVFLLKNISGDLIGMVDLSLQTSSGSLDALNPSFLADRLKAYKNLQPYICNLLIRPQYRNRGYAKILISLCERESLSWGKTDIYLHVEKRTLPALNLYLTTGFSPVKDANNDLVFMRKRVAPRPQVISTP